MESASMESIEVLPTDFALAYSVLSRRVAAIDAILSSRQGTEHCLREVRSQVDAAMAVIEQVETVRFVLKPS
jgi:hypothetical protein